MPNMSKRMSGFLAFLLAVVCTLAGISVPNSAGAPPAPQSARVAASSARNDAIVAATAEILKETSTIRQLPILRPVKSGAQSRPEIERMLMRKVDEQTTNEEMHATELTLRKFGLTPGSFEYRPFIIKLLTEQVAGYYDTSARRFHLADWLELEGQKPVMAHELTHALQDQHFNLRRFEDWPKGDSDAELATHALIEGDATLAMMLYMTKHPLIALAFARSISGAGVSSEQFNQAPRALRETLLFPYLQGMEWASVLYARGGWSLVSKAFTRLPQSTEQILHAEKYFSHEQPLKVALPNLANVLNGGSDRQTANSKQSTAGRNDRTAGSARVGARGNRARGLPPARRPLPTSPWRLVDSDVNGEWGYYLILDQFLNSAEESKRAAAGWAGDRYALYEGPVADQVLVHVSTWDTADDAREFFEAYAKRTALRYPDAQPLDSSETAGSNSAIRPSKSEMQMPDSLRRWQTGEGVVVMELRGSHVLIVEGAPEGMDTNALVKALR